MIVNEFVDEKSLWKAARVAFESVPEGYFLKMGKRLDGKVTLYWLGYPVVVKDG